jgi:hypothetical protein
MASEKTPRTLSEIGLTARALATIDGRHKKEATRWPPQVFK